MKTKDSTWTPEQEEILRTELGYITNREIGDLIGKTATQVGSKVLYMRKTGLNIPSKEEVQAIKAARVEDEVNFIKSNPGMPAKDIARKINRSIGYSQIIINEVMKDENAKARIEKERELQRLREKREKEEHRKRVKKLIAKKKKETKRLEKLERVKRIKAIEKKREKEEIQAIYNKIISEPVEEGVFKNNLKVKLGQSYEIERNQGTRSNTIWQKFKGKVIHETRDHFTVKNKTRSETFLKVDFLIGEYKIKEVS